MPSPYFNPGFVVDGQPVMQSDLDAAHAQRIAGSELVKTMVLGMAGGIKAYHGSPYDFERFDLSKIGTGEGAQAYGHGLYFAGNEGVARSYRDALSRQTDRPVSGTDVRLPNWIANSLDSGFNPQEHINDFEGRIREAQAGIDSGRDNQPWLTQGNIVGLKKVLGALKDVQAGRATVGPAGRMYEVNINADPAHLLDWDKPLAEQSPQVREALNREWMAHPVDHANMTGASIYHAQGTPPDVTASALHQAGIPGIQYLDQGSRAAGEGTRNYVMFDPNLIDILRKYGLAGLMTGAGSAAAAYSPYRQTGQPAQ